MGVTIHVNGATNSLVHKGSMGIAKSTLPDVCKTPSPGGPVPIPYPVIVSMSSNLKKGTKTVKVDGKKMAAVKGSEFSRCSGDEPGTAGGVKSSTNMKEATWLLYSFDVKLDGKNACRLSDKMMMNHGNTACLGGVFQGPVAVVDAIGQDVADEICEAICDTRKKQKSGEISTTKPPNGPPPKYYRSLQDHVAGQFGSGFPLNEPNKLAKGLKLVAEMTWTIPKKIGGAFIGVMSKTRPGMHGSIIRGLAEGSKLGKGKTFRPDFTLTRRAGKISKTNPKAFIEVKFKGDELTKNQKLAKQQGAKLHTIEEEDCKCD
jgi:hypothetical protein